MLIGGSQSSDPLGFHFVEQEKHERLYRQKARICHCIQIRSMLHFMYLAKRRFCYYIPRQSYGPTQWLDQVEANVYKFILVWHSGSHEKGLLDPMIPISARS